MSVWPAIAPDPALSGREGTLVSLSIGVAPQYLEALLEALARLDFPVNPQIYHDAETVYVFADGHEENEPITLVEFPAYAGRLDEVRRALSGYGFDAGSLQVRSMLEQIHAGAPRRRQVPVGRA